MITQILHWLNVLLCVLIVLRILTYTRPGRPFASRALAYWVQLCAGISAVQSVLLQGPPPTVTNLILLSFFTIAVWTVGGDVLSVFQKPGLKHEKR